MKFHKVHPAPMNMVCGRMGLENNFKPDFAMVPMMLLLQMPMVAFLPVRLFCPDPEFLIYLPVITIFTPILGFCLI